MRIYAYIINQDKLPVNTKDFLVDSPGVILKNRGGLNVFNQNILADYILALYLNSVMKHSRLRYGLILS